MSDVERAIRTRLKWVQLYQTTSDADLVCRRCGISRSALKKWWRRFQPTGEDGLHEHNRRLLKTPSPKVTPPFKFATTALTAWGCLAILASLSANEADYEC